jgi:hypothetical protein
VTERDVEIEVGFEDEDSLEELLQPLRVGHPAVRHGVSVPREPGGPGVIRLRVPWRDL